jgi:hypothetical protein
MLTFLFSQPEYFSHSGALLDRKYFAEMAELADARDLKSLGPKARTGSIPVLGTIKKIGVINAKQTRGGAAW